MQQKKRGPFELDGKTGAVALQRSTPENKPLPD